MEGQTWDAKHYDAKIGYVSGYGESVVDLLGVAAGERILDLGCGTGDLASRIAESGADVLGIDSSPEMIGEARRKYPRLLFQVADGEAFALEAPVDGVFSNAALHWMRNPAKTARCVYAALRPGGRFVGELGGKGNVALIAEAVERTLEEMGVADARERNPWYFPSVGEYAALLEREGFRVRYAAHFDRQTPFGDGRRGLANWLEAFCGSYFAGFPAERKAEAYARIEARLRPALFDVEAGSWVVDFKRLRFQAEKEADDGSLAIV